MAAQAPPPKSDDVAVTELLSIPEIQELLTSACPSEFPTNNDDNLLPENKSEEIGLEGEKSQRQVPKKVTPDGFEAEMQELQDDEVQGVTEPITRPIPRSIASLAELDTGTDTQHTQLTRQEKTVSSASQRLRSAAVSLDDGRQIHGLNEAESEALRLKLHRQTAYLRSRKAEKGKVRQQKKQIQELQAELAHLQDVEGQLKEYEGRSVESLESELGDHKDEVASLSVKLQHAAAEERDWITWMTMPSK